MAASMAAFATFEDFLVTVAAAEGVDIFGAHLVYVVSIYYGSRLC